MDVDEPSEYPRTCPTLVVQAWTTQRSLSVHALNLADRELVHAIIKAVVHEVVYGLVVVAIARR
jgi:hypothetical protein